MPQKDSNTRSEQNAVDAAWEVERRRLLQLGGVGLGSLAALGGAPTVSRAATGCADGPFERTYEVGTVNMGQLRARQAREGRVGDLSAARAADDATVEDLRAAARRGDHPQPSASSAQSATGAGGGIDVLTEYDGVNAEETRGGVPSDSQVAVGDGKIVHALNQQVAIFNKQSGRRQQMVRLERLFEPVIPEPEGGFVDDVPFVFDPRARYDRNADRYVVAATQFQQGLTADGEVIDREDLEEDSELEGGDDGESEAGADAVSRPPRGWWVVGVSATSNPNGEWHVYRIPPLTNTGLVDYPTLGLDRDAVYLAQNFFGAEFQVTMVTLDKAAMYAGEDVTAHHFTGLQNPDSPGATFTVQPALQPFSGGSDGTYYLVNSEFLAPSSNLLTLWEVTDPVSDPSLECFSVEVEPFGFPPPARQPDSSAFIDTIDTRLMNADLDGGSLWTAHAIQFDWNGDGRAVAAVKWYEVDLATRSVVQSGVFGEPGTSYFLPTVGAEGGRTVFSLNVSGPDTFPRMDVAARDEGTPAGELADSLTVEEGKSRYDIGEGLQVQRWGDYNGVGVDPSSERFWAVSQYSPDVDIPPEAEERDPYHTRIAELELDLD